MNTLTTQTRMPVARGAMQSEVAKAQQEIQAYFVMAQQCPRDEEFAKEKILKACLDQELAKEALYAFRKGGALVTGPSIRLLEEISRIWGRITYGWQVLDEEPGDGARPGRSQIKAFALDLQELNPVSRTFYVSHSYKAHGQTKVLTDERDIYEYVSNLAQRRTRSCIEALIPAKVLNAAVKAVEHTLKNANTEPLEKRLELMQKHFYSDFGIDKKMLEKFLGSDIKAATESQMVRMRAVYQSLKDGAAKPEDYFDLTVKESSAQEPPKDDKKKPAKEKTSPKDKKSDAQADSPQSSADPAPGEPAMISPQSKDAENESTETTSEIGDLSSMFS